MAKSLICPITTEHDRKVAEILNKRFNDRTWNGARVANFRGIMIDHDKLPSAFTDDTIQIESLYEQIADEIIKFYHDDNYWKSRQQYEFEKTNAFFDRLKKLSFSEEYKRIKEVFDNGTLDRRVKSVAHNFSLILDQLYNKVSSIKEDIDRTSLCLGVVVDGKIYGGQSNILNHIYSTLVKQYKECLRNVKAYEDYMEKSNLTVNKLSIDQLIQYRIFSDRINEFQKMLENWSVICALARVLLRITEKLKLGNTINYVENADVINDTDNFSDFDAETAYREAFNLQKDKLSAFGSLSAEVRRVLGRIPVYENGKIKIDDLGQVEYMDPIEAHQKLSMLLKGYYREKSIERKLLQLSQENSWITSVYNLYVQDKQFRTMFTINMHKGFQLYSIILQELGKLKTKVLNKFQNDSYSNYKVNLFKNTIKPKFVEDEFKRLEELRGKVTPNSITKLDMSNVTDRIVFITDFYTQLGIDISFDESYMIASGRQWKHLEKNIINNTLYASKFYQINVKNKGRTLYKALNQKDNKYNGKFNNSLDEFIQKSLLILDSSKTLIYERRVTFKDSTGKNASFDSLVESSFMTDVFGTIESFVEDNDNNGLIQYLIDRFFISSLFYIGDRNDLTDINKINPDKILHSWLRELYLDASKGFEENGFASNFKFERFLGDGSENQEFENFTSKLHIITNLTMWKRNIDISLQEIESIEEAYGYYPVFILGDSGIAKFIQGKIYNTQNTTGEENQDKILDEFYNIFLSEIRRKAIFKAFLEDAKKKKIYIKKSFADKPFEFSILTFLNDPKYKQEEVLKWDRELFKSEMKNFLDEKTKEFKENIQKYGVLETETNNLNVTIVSALNIENKKLDAFLTNYYWNNKLNMANQLLFFSIDPVFYPNTKEIQKRYKEIHASGVPLDIDVLEAGESRHEKVVYFEDIDISSEVYKEFDNAISYNFGIESLKRQGKNITNISREDIIKEGKTTLKYSKYKSNTLTDGLGYRTLDSYRKVSRMAGTWTAAHEKAYKLIKKLRNKNEKISAEDIQKIAELAIIFLPIKPFVYTIELYTDFENDTMLIPVLHKYSETVIIPELMGDGMLKTIGLWMEKNNIDVLASTKVVKVGCFGLTNIQYKTDDDGNIIEHDNQKQTINTKEDLELALDKGVQHEISYSDYRIQTNVPLHFNEEALFGTQIRKLVMSQLRRDINVDYSHYVGGEAVRLYDNDNIDKQKLNGYTLLTFYNALIISNILESFEVFASTTEETKRLSELFILNVISNGREALDNIFAYTLTQDDKFVIPLFEGALEHDAASTLFSMFKKAVNKQKIKGGSAVQASALGLASMSIDGDLECVVDPNNPDNILYAEVEMPFDFSYTDVIGKDIELKFSDYCNADGTLILDESEELDIKNPKNKMYLSYYKTDSEGKKHHYIPKIEKDFPGILTVIAYRIPTERAYSMLNMQVKRFSPITAGGTLKVPVLYTTIAGFDFDIDKLYLMFKQFVENKPFYEYYDYNIKEEDSKKEKEYKRLIVKNIYEQIYKTHPELIEVSNKTKIDYSDYLGDIYNQFYEDHPEIRASLINLRGKNKTEKLVTYFEKSEVIKNFASNRNMSIPELKLWIVETYGEVYNYQKEVIIEGSLRYSFKEGLSKEEKTKAFEEAASALNIPLKKNLNSRFIEYDYDRLPIDNNRVARNNMLLNIMSNRLMDPETFIERYSPGGFPQASLSAKMLREVKFGKSKEEGKIPKTLQELRNIVTKEGYKDAEPNYDPTDPMTVIIYNQLNLIASKLIGIFANLNANHAISLFLNKLELRKNISFFGHSYKNLIKAPEGIDVNGTMAEFLAAAVDAVKDPTLGYLNLNTLTADAGAMLARIGYTMEEIGILFNLPIIIKICEKAFNDGISLDKAIEHFRNLYLNNESLKLEEVDKYDLNLLTENYLISNLYKEDDKIQFNVLKLFEDIVSASKDLTNYVSVTRYTASNSVGSSFGDFYSLELKVDNFIKKLKENTLSLDIEVNSLSKLPIIDNDLGLLELDKRAYVLKIQEHPFGYEQCMFDMNRKIQKEFSKYFPYESPLYKKIRNTFKNYSKKENLDAKTIDLIHRDFLSYIFSSTLGLFNPNTKVPVKNEETGNDYTSREYYTEKFSERLLDFIQELKDSGEYYKIVSDDFLYFYEDKNNKILCNLRNVGGLNSTQKDILMRSWEDLNKKYPQIARDLFLYNFHKAGFNFTSSSFINFAPTSLKLSIIVHRENGKDINYIEFLENIKNGNYNISELDYVRLFVLNHSNNYNFVVTLNKNAKTKLKLLISDNSIPDQISLDKETLRNIPLLNIKVTKDQEIIVVPGFKYIDKNGTEYLYVLNDFSSNVITDGVVYTRVTPLGYTNKSTYYTPAGLTYSNNSEFTSDNNLNFTGTTNMDNNDKTNESNIDIDQNALLAEIKQILMQRVFDSGNTNLIEDYQKLLYVWESVDIEKQKKVLDRVKNKQDIWCVDAKGKPTKLC